MRSMLLVLSLFMAQNSFAQTTINFAFKDGQLRKMIETYANASKKKFVIDPGVQGKADIITHEKVTLEEAYSLLSSALAVNGYAITQQGDINVVLSARNVQRSLIPVTNELPALKPERMVSYVYTPKYVPAHPILVELRILSSKDGEMVAFGENKLLFTDWVSNLHRIRQTLVALDTADAKMSPPRQPRKKKEDAD